MAMDVTATLRAYDAGFSKGMDEAMAKLKGVSKFGGSTGKSMLKMGAVFGAGSLIAGKALGAITNGVGEVVRTMSDSQATWKTFEGSMAYMGKSSGQIEKVKKSLQQYAQQTIYSASDMASTYQQLAAVGVKNTTRLVKGFGGLASAADDPKQAMKTLSQQATQMAAKPMVQWGDFRLMLEQTPTGMSAVAKAMGMTTSELVKNVQDGKIKTEDFFKAIEKAGNSTSFYKMATQYKTMGQAVDGLVETLAGKLTPTFNKVSSYGIKGISSLVNYLDTVNFNALIPKIDKVANYIGNSFNKALPALKSTWEAIKTGASAAFDGIKQIASSLAPDVKGVFNSIVETAKAWGPTFQSAFGAIGSIAKAALPVLVAGVKGALQGLQSLLGVVQKLAPVFKSLFENKGVQSLAVGVASAVVAYKSLNTAVTGAKAALDGIKTVGTVGKTIVSSMKGVAGLKNKFTTAATALDALTNSSKIATIAQKALNAAAAVNPYVLIAAAIAAVVAGLAYFFTQTKTGQAVWQAFTDFLKSTWNSLAAVAGPIWQGVLNAISPIVDAVKNLWSSFQEFITTLWQGIVALATPIWNVLVTVISAVWNNIVTAVSVAINLVSNVISNVMNVISVTWSGIWNVISTVVSTVWSIIQTVISTAINAVAAILSAVTSAIQGNWSAVWTNIQNLVSIVWNGIISVVSTAINGVLSVIQAVMSAISSIWGAIWNAIKSEAGAIWNGIKSVVSSGINGARQVIASAMNGIRAVVSGGWNTIKSIFSSSAQALAGLVHVDLSGAGRAIMNSLLSGLRSAWGAVKHFVGGIADWIKAHKGPISYDRRLLIPAGKAIMAGLNQGLNGSFSDVKDNVKAMAGEIAQGFNLDDSKFTTSFNSDVNHTYTMDVQGAQQQQNELLRRLLDKQSVVQLNDGTLVGKTYDKYDKKLGEATRNERRWSYGI